MRRPEELVFALCHEIGNLLAAIRLHGRWRDPDTGLRLSGLAGRAGALLALIRPLLSPGCAETRRFDPLELIDALRPALDDPDDPRLRIDLGSAAALPPVVADGETLCQLLLAELFAALEDLPEGEQLRLGAVALGDAVAFVLEDRLGRARGAAAGRRLVWDVAEVVLAGWGGRFARETSGDAQRVAFQVPVARD